LELFRTQSGERKGSLALAIDRTVTSVGSRLLKRYLSFPSACCHVINSRQDAVEFFIKNQIMCESVRGVIHSIPDMERILTRVKLSRCSPKDMYMLGRALTKILQLVRLICGIDNPMLARIAEELGDPSELLKLIDGTLVENNITNFKDGGFVNPLCNPHLAKMVHVERDGDMLVQQLRDEYRELTGVSSLKVTRNNLLGYYVEVPASYKVNNEHFIHRQSLTNTTRYTTVALRNLEEKITVARSEIIELEIQIFRGLCTRILEEAQSISLAAEAVAELDVLSSMAELAAEHKYVRPIVDDSKEFTIKKGRHPVVEMGTHFIANDSDLSRENRLCLITGPNMAGKSTFLRQNALIAILAHIGSFVPASYARIGIVDKIFSRVGASDNITLGYSTFMVEMTETAAILNQATDKSLVVLDEIGRGTGIHDGLSIALAVIEHIHDVTKSRAICVTHYHELPRLSSHLQCVRCFHMKIEEWKGKTVFLHTLVSGISDRSYGIYVAELAGFPKSTLKRARFFMEKLQADESCVSGNENLDKQLDIQDVMQDS
ncbi:MAG: DNA mismatch repair protein MutS, partial [Anaplasma sp.]